MKLALLLPLLIASGSVDPKDHTGAFKYPSTRQDSVVETYHGQKIADPYRWLEDNESSETTAWIERQNLLTKSYLQQLPSRSEFQRRLTSLWSYDKLGAPFRRGERYFYTRASDLQNQRVLYQSANARGENATVLVDPNSMSKDGTVALSGYEPSSDGKLIAYGVSAAGSDWCEWRIKNVETNEDLKDKLQWIKFGRVSFAPDNSGVYYGRYPQSSNTLKDTNYYHCLYFHKLGTEQKDDKPVLETSARIAEAQKEWSYSGDVTEDGRFLIIHVHRNTNPENLLYYKDLSQPGAPIVRLVDSWEGKFSFVDNDGPIFYVETNWNAPRGRVLAIDIRKPERSNWKELIPQSADNLRNIASAKNSFVAHYLVDAHSSVRLFSRNGNPEGECKLPGIGSVGWFSSQPADNEVFYTYSGFTTPAEVHSFNVATKTDRLVIKPEVNFEPSAFVTSQVFYKSKDGTQVPMFLVHKKGLDPAEAPRSTFLYGYGGFDAAMLPVFRPDIISWLERGGLYAMPNLRGGGEYGEDWHQAGMKEKKQNVFDDFIAAANWLIEQKYTTSAKLAINGASNGGLLVGAALTQRPELFAVAVPEVGVLDMLRYHKFTIGHAWTGEYGASDDEGAFKYLFAYSPLHNVKAARYPATLVLTGDHDDRVFPAHSFKFIAALQAAQKGPAPVLIRIETRTGHGAGKPTSKQIEESADKWSFVWENTKRACHN